MQTAFMASGYTAAAFFMLLSLPLMFNLRFLVRTAGAFAVVLYSYLLSLTPVALLIYVLYMVSNKL